MVPLGRKSPASLPSRFAASASSARTVGSPSRPSSPSSAWRMRSSIFSVGLVTVSLPKSMEFISNPLGSHQRQFVPPQQAIDQQQRHHGGQDEHGGGGGGNPRAGAFQGLEHDHGH